MAISGDYATPVSVNGFSCKNCTEVDLANKHIDPAHPKDGPFGINAKDKTHAPGHVDKLKAAAEAAFSPDAVTFGGALKAAFPDGPAQSPPPRSSTAGALLDVRI